MKMTEGDASCEKRVYLVRHAQSLQNVAVAQFFFNGDWAALGRMLRLGHDSPISEEGAPVKTLQSGSTRVMVASPSSKMSKLWSTAVPARSDGMGTVSSG